MMFIQITCTFVSISTYHRDRFIYKEVEQQNLVSKIQVYINIIRQIEIKQTKKQQFQREDSNMLKSQQSFQERTLKHDINHLLALFNQLDSPNLGYITFEQLQKLFSVINISMSLYYALNLDYDQSKFQFDDVLSIIGLIQIPQQPSIYVVSFVKILAQYRNKCIEKSQDNQKSLVEAKQIGDRIKKITKNELERRKDKLLSEHNKIYQEMNKTQNNQFSNFEDQWKKYLYEFKAQTQQRIQKTKVQKIKELSFQSNKLVKTARRHSLVTSPKLIQLQEKKKWLVKEGKYAEAIKINFLIDSEKKKIEDHKEESLDYSLKKRLQSMKKKNQNALDYIQNSMSINMNKLLAKKKEGEHLMQLRMRNLREEAEKKLSDHLRGQLARLKGMFSRASR